MSPQGLGDRVKEGGGLRAADGVKRPGLGQGSIIRLGTGFRGQVRDHVKGQASGQGLGRSGLGSEIRSSVSGRGSGQVLGVRNQFKGWAFVQGLGRSGLRSEVRESGQDSDFRTSDWGQGSGQGPGIGSRVRRGQGLGGQVLG